MSAEDTERFVQPASGSFGVGCAALFLGLPVIGATVQAFREAPMLVPVPIGMGLALLGLAYWMGAEERTVTLGPEGMRSLRTRVLFGHRRPSRVEWTIPLDALRWARWVRRRTPSSHGGWSESVRLELPQHRVIHAFELGGTGDPKSAFNALVNALEQRFGDGFVRVETQG
jgi:hypothetical protein